MRLHLLEEEAKRQSEEEAESRRVMLEEVSVDMRELEVQAKQGKTHFLDYLYRRHPPPKAGQIESLSKRDNNCVISALRHYHPDKNMGECEKWKLLCGHITKHLNGFGKL